MSLSEKGRRAIIYKGILLSFFFIYTANVIVALPPKIWSYYVRVFQQLLRWLEEEPLQNKDTGYRRCYLKHTLGLLHSKLNLVKLQDNPESEFLPSVVS